VTGQQFSCDLLEMRLQGSVGVLLTELGQVALRHLWPVVNVIELTAAILFKIAHSLVGVTRQVAGTWRIAETQAADLKQSRPRDVLLRSCAQGTARRAILRRLLRS
jgi:hypothetical protein